jgi:PmbA protein
MDPRIRDALARQPGVDDWTLRHERTRGVQLYLVGSAVENVRHVHRESYQLEVYHRHGTDADHQMGSASLPLSTADLDTVGALLTEGVTIAGHVHSPPWELPGPAEVPEVPLSDPRIASEEAAMRTALELADVIRDAVAARGNGVRLSAAELFLTASEEELENSRGASAVTESTQVLLELNLLAGSGDDEAEAFRQAEARRIEDLGLERVITDLAEGAVDMVRAGPPRTHQGPVVLSGAAVSQLLGGTVLGKPGAILTQASAEAAYLKISRLEVGQPIWGEGGTAGDPVSVRANARLPYGGGSYRVDPDGVPAQDLLVIEDGVLVARPATKRYADYLGIPATGYAVQIQLPPGPRAGQSLLETDGHLCEVHAFSAPNVDALSGNFGMEIRVGYEHLPDGSRRPVRGGSVTGNLFDALADVRFSSETALFPTYQGPASVRFGRLHVSGAA